MNTISKIIATLIGLLLVAGITAACGGGGGHDSGPNFARMAAVVQTKCGYPVDPKPASDSYERIAGQDVVHTWTFNPADNATQSAAPLDDTQQSLEAQGIDQVRRTATGQEIGGVLVSENGHTLCPGQWDGNYVWSGQTFEPGAGSN